MAAPHKPSSSNTQILTLPRLHEAQRRIVDEAKRWNVVCCGRRFGKSRLGIDRIVGPALEGYPVAWFSPNYKMLAEMWRETKLVLLPITKAKSEQEHRLDLTTGGVIDFWSLDDPNSARGRKYKRIVIDEAAHIRELEEAVQKVLRPTLSDYRGDAWFLSTPKGRNFFWECFQRGLDPEEDEWACWQMPTSANPFIHSEEIAAARRELPASIFSQEYLAEFLEVGGRYFDEFDPQKHLILDRDVPKHWHTFGGLDFGSAAPFSFHLCAADELGSVDVFGECYEAGLLPEAQAQRVCALLAARGVGRASTLIAADPSMFPPTDPAKRLGEYPIEAFWRLGLNCVPAVNNRVAGWTRVKEFLHRPGGLRIHKGACPNLARTIPLMTPDANNPEDLDTTLEDHGCDSARYSLMTRPRPSGPDPAIPIPKQQKSFVDEFASVPKPDLFE